MDSFNIFFPLWKNPCLIQIPVTAEM
ncbi:MAG: hypothetical protein UZ09_BCD002000412, partial [Bacteroidetes bacterium OLB9]